MVRVIASALCLSVLVTTVFANASFAGDCAPGTCCNQSDITGPIVRPDHHKEEEGKGDINLSGLSVLSGLLAIGQGIRADSTRTAATIDKNFEAQDAFMRKVIASMGASREKAENTRVFGPDSKAYNTFSDEFGSGATSGFVARDQVSSKIREDLQGHSREFARRKEILTRLQKSPSGFEVSGNNTMTPQELATSKEIAKTAIDPHPALNLSEGLNKGRTAGHYESTRKTKEAGLMLPIAVLSDSMADHAPVIDSGGWPEEVYEKMGGEGNANQAVDGKLSTNGLLEMLTDMRFANQDWAAGQDGLHGMTEAGVLRELLLSQVGKLMVEYRNMLWLDRTAAMMAQKQLSQNKEFTQVLEDAKFDSFR